MDAWIKSVWKYGKHTCGNFPCFSKRGFREEFRYIECRKTPCFSPYPSMRARHQVNRTFFQVLVRLRVMVLRGASRVISGYWCVIGHAVISACTQSQCTALAILHSQARTLHLSLPLHSLTSKFLVHKFYLTPSKDMTEELNWFHT